MATPVVIAGTTYNIPTNGQSPSWGDDLNSLLVALVAISNTAVGPADILTTSFTIANNSGTANVTGASWDTTSVRSAIISYSIYRSSSTTEMSEAGQIYISYKSTAGTWEIAQNYTGTSGVVFSITNSGQLQYTSSNFSGISYTGKMKFSARSFLQA